ncbi:LCP family protein [Streptomyces sp. NPDC020875]|uniref:LCP family protein n=1 Tax=Streptomyces sp. NPDC020875 TaxID=3154898 RepID=UPI0033E820CB
MNDQQPYDPYQPRIIGYDAYGQPVYQQPQQPHEPPYDGSHGPESGQDYGQEYDGGAYAPGYPPGPGQSAEYGDRPYEPHVPSQPDDTYGGGTYGGGAYGYSGYEPAPYTGYDTGTGQQPVQEQTYGYDPEGRPYESYGYDPGPGPGTGPLAVDTTQQWTVPAQQPAPGDGPGVTGPETASLPGPRRSEAAGDPGGPDARGDFGDPDPFGDPDRRDYRTEQFAFIQEPDDESEDVIDWLKFTESRSERREEARRRGRNRVVALAVVLALALISGVGWLWAEGALPGMSDDGKKKSVSAGAQKRDVIVVHLRDTRKKGTSTALLVDNVTTGRGTTVLLPDALSVTDEQGATTTLAKSVEADGAIGTRDAIGTALGARIGGTWRLDTPFLENLVELVGGIDLTTDTDVPGESKNAAPLVKKGENQTLNGRAAVAYATRLGPGEPEAKQLQRFGQVMQGVLKKFPSDAESAIVTVETLGQLLDPSFTEKDLGASLAELADQAKGGDYATLLLSVGPDGRLTEQASAGIVRDVLGGSVTVPEQGAPVRVGIRDATGKAKTAEAARIALGNAGYAVVDGGSAGTAGTSTVTYGDDARKAEAVEVAKTLGLPATAVKKGTAPPNAEIGVVLGGDYRTD